MESDRLNHSLSAQISYYSELIQSNPEWIYVGVYADSGISGTGTRKRAEFQYFSATQREFTVPLKKPFGYEYNWEKFVIIPQEAEAVKLMYRYYSEGWKIADISRELESKLKSHTNLTLSMNR